MADTAAHIALLFFSRTAGAEQLAKPYGSKGQKVHEALISHSYQTAAQSSLPIYWLSEEEQVGDTFGERLANAYEALFAKGYEKVIAIGNDCPELGVADIKHAADLLQNTDWVLGPALDGGLYLLGLSATVYDRQHFIDLAWEKSDLLPSLESSISLSQQTSSILEIKTDIDSKAGLIACLSSLGRLHPLSYLLAFLLFPRAERFVLSSPITRGKLSSSQALRAPPAAA